MVPESSLANNYSASDKFNARQPGALCWKQALTILIINPNVLTASKPWTI